MQNFYLIIIASIIVHLFIFYKAIGITYFTRSLKETNGKLALTDNEKILFNAKKYKIFAWPSSMHDMPFNRAQLREFWFLAVSRVVPPITVTVSRQCPIPNVGIFTPL